MNHTALPKTMRAIGVRDHGGVEALEALTLPVPEPGAGQVLVRIQAAAVNPFDTILRQGVMKQMMPLPLPTPRKHFPSVDAGVLARAEAVELSPFSALTMHHALHEPLRYRSGESDLLQQVCMMELLPTDMSEFRRYFDDLRYHRMPDPIATMAAGTPSGHDVSRAPAGKASGYMITFAPWNLNNEGPAAWATHRERIGQAVLRGAARWVENLTPDNIIGTCMHTPVDLDGHSPSFRHGDIHGCAPYFYQMNGHRPTPDLANYTCRVWIVST